LYRHLPYQQHQHNSRTGTDKDYTDDFMEQLDLSEIEQYLKEQDATEEISFYELIKELATGNFSCDGQKLTQAVGRILWGELQDNKAILVTVLLLAISCAFLKNFSDIFHNTYISEVCFFLIYMEMTVLLLQSYQMMREYCGNGNESDCRFYEYADSSIWHVSGIFHGKFYSGRILPDCFYRGLYCSVGNACLSGANDETLYYDGIYELYDRRGTF